MRAILGPTTASHPRAAATLLELLALWHQQALSVVLRADLDACSSATRLIDDLGFASRLARNEDRRQENGGPESVRFRGWAPSRSSMRGIHSFDW